jgi:hypothetical protein
MEDKLTSEGKCGRHSALPDSEEKTTPPKITSINDFIKINAEIMKEFDGEAPSPYSFYYRGQSGTYKLLPGIYRDNYIQYEQAIFREVTAHNPADFSDFTYTAEKLIKMQHYGAPTRLLDLTKSPLVALYFACVKQEKKTDGTFYIIAARKEFEKYYDGDIVSIIANICQMNNNFVIDKIFKKEKNLRLLLNHIRHEKPGFMPRIRIDTMQKCYIMHPKMDNWRIRHQQGLFLLFGIKGEKSIPAEPLTCDKSSCCEENKQAKLEETMICYQYIIPECAKGQIAKELETQGITKEFLFPELENFAECIKKRYGNSNAEAPVAELQTRQIILRSNT